MRSLLVIFAISLGTQIAHADGASLGSPGSDNYSCPGNGDSTSSQDEDARKGGNPVTDKSAACSDKCQDLQFDCADHQVKVAGEPLKIGDDDWLGCYNQTGVGNGAQPHKITEHGCGGGEKGLLPSTEPKILSDPLPCANCVIHRMPKGERTAGCIGLEGKLFDFVYNNCGGCSYTIIPEGVDPTGTPNQSTGAAQSKVSH